MPDKAVTPTSFPHLICRSHIGGGKMTTILWITTLAPVAISGVIAMIADEKNYKNGIFYWMLGIVGTNMAWIIAMTH
jgi:hypothetical protein